MDVETEAQNQMHDVSHWWNKLDFLNSLCYSEVSLQETSTPTISCWNLGTHQRDMSLLPSCQPTKDLEMSLYLFKFQFACMGVKSFKSCPTFCDPMGCSPPGSSVHGILQARILEWVAMPFSRESSQSRIELVSLMSPALRGGFFTTSAIWETQGSVYLSAKWT